MKLHLLTTLLLGFAGVTTASNCPGACHTCQGPAFMTAAGYCPLYCSKNGWCGPHANHQEGADCRACDSARSNKQFWSWTVTGDGMRTATFSAPSDYDPSKSTIESVELFTASRVLKETTYSGTYNDIGALSSRICANVMVKGNWVRRDETDKTFEQCAKNCAFHKCKYFSYSFARDICAYVPGMYTEVAAQSMKWFSGQTYGTFGPCTAVLGQTFDIYKVKEVAVWEADEDLTSRGLISDASDGSFAVTRVPQEINSHVMVVTKVNEGGHIHIFTDRFRDGQHFASDEEVDSSNLTVPGVPQCDNKWTKNANNVLTCTADDGTEYSYGSTCD